MRPFLTAEWKNLILLTYSVDPILLTSILPKGLELDIYKERAFVSLVAFNFNKTRVKGLPIPFHINFPEVNLRYYVKYTDKKGKVSRGVVFIREFVPKKAIAFVAQKIYNEPYLAIPMTANIRKNEDELVINHSFKYGGFDHSLEFYVDQQTQLPPENTTEHFFKEHEWGFGLNHKKQLIKYQVKHPVWRIHPLTRRFDLNVDFGILYGDEWSFLNQKIPYNIIVAEGSPIQVFPGTILD